MVEPSIPLPVELKGVPRPVLERYVFERISQFSRVFASRLLTPEHPGVVPAEQAFNEAVAILGSQQHAAQTFALRFAHRCRFLACLHKECTMCSNNPEKRCSIADNFDECYADNMTLKAKCKAEVSVEAFFTSPSDDTTLPSGVQVQLFVIDGDSCTDDAAPVPEAFRELLKSDEGQTLLAAGGSGTQDDGFGRIIVALQGGCCRLPDLSITDKVDTFRSQGQTFTSFRLVAQAVQQDFAGRIIVMPHVAPAVSSKFVIKTQRALNDFSKPAYPHYKDRLTRLKFIGGVTADRLRDIQTHMPGVPFSSIETVEQLRQLMVFTDQNRQLEGKLLDVLSMKGRHKHKWDYLREVLAERIVYDDAMHRAWFPEDSPSQGVLFSCKQGLVALDKPFGLVERVVVDGQHQLQVFPARSAERMELMKLWRASAEESWLMPGHPGWSIVSEPMELVDAASSSQMDPMEGMEHLYGYEGSSRPQVWSPAAEPPSHSSRGSLPGNLLLPGSGSLPAAYSPRRVAQPPGAAEPQQLAGAFHFTAARAIGEIKVGRLAHAPAQGSGNYSNHPDVLALSAGGSGAGVGAVGGGDTSPFANTPHYSNPYSSPRSGSAGGGPPAAPHSLGGGSSPTGSGSPRSGSGYLDNVMLPLRALSFSHQQRARQVSSSAECTPARHPPSPSLRHPASPSLSNFARAKQDQYNQAQALSQAQGQGQGRGRALVPQHLQRAEDPSGSWLGFDSSIEAIASTKRRRASLPDYTGSGSSFADAMAMRQAGQDPHMRSELEHGLSQGNERPGQQQFASSLQQQQQQQAWQQAVLAYADPSLDVEPDGERGGLNAMMLHMDRFSDGMMDPRSAALDSPHLVASVEQHLHLSDHGPRSLPAAARAALMQDAAAAAAAGRGGGGAPLRAPHRSLNLSEQSGGGGAAAAAIAARPSYATSASMLSAASGHSALKRGGLNLAMDPGPACHGSLSPSSTSVPSAASGQSSMQRGPTLNLSQPASAPSPNPGPMSNEAASAYVSEVAALQGIKFDPEQIERWFDQTQAMDRCSDNEASGAGAAALVDKQLSRMMERSGSFNQLLDSMLKTTSCELPDIQ